MRTGDKRWLDSYMGRIRLVNPKEKIKNSDKRVPLHKK